MNGKIYEGYYYSRNQPKNKKELELTAEGWKVENYMYGITSDKGPTEDNIPYGIPKTNDLNYASFKPSCPPTQKDVDEWVGIL